MLLVFLVTLTGNAQAISQNSANHPGLVYVSIGSSDDLSCFASTQLPLYTTLHRGVLTGANLAGQQAISNAGLRYLVLDAELHPGSYYLAQSRSGRPAPDYAAYGQVLLHTSNEVLLSMDPSQVDALAQAGAELSLISLTSKPIPTSQNEPVNPAVVEPDSTIQWMIDQISTTQVYTYDRQLAGELPVWVDDAWYTIPSRYTYSGTPIQKATHFVYQHMQDLGLDVQYDQWGGPTYPNVIGEIPGLTNPDTIYIIGGHLDDMSGVPGADDNASGSVATLLAADIFSEFQWGCTLRFAFWTGEEQGLKGSADFAKRAHLRGDNILGYLNLDMIAWNTLGSAPGITLSYSTSIPASQQLALLFADVVDAYNLNLIPNFTQNDRGSDHNSFWDYGYSSILGIEDWNDFNPYYHKGQDTPAHTDPAYFTDFIKASVGTFAHLSDCMVPTSLGGLAGHVTESGTSNPLEGATVEAEDALGHHYSDSTDSSGYYSMTLPADTYTVTASLAGYLPSTITSTVVEGEVNALDLILEEAPCYPVTQVDFTWLPLEPFNGDPVNFTASYNGTLPIDFQWNFGDTLTGTGATISHTYAQAGIFITSLTATNACSGVVETSKDLLIGQKIWGFLPLINR